MYLYRSKQTSAAHHWDGLDTACRMWSTGGMSKKRKYETAETLGGRRVCAMCEQVKANRSAEK